MFYKQYTIFQFLMDQIILVPDSNTSRCWGRSRSWSQKAWSTALCKTARSRV